MSNAEFTTFGAAPAFSNPLPVPSVDPDAAVTQCVEFNAAYLPYILGCLAPLLLPEAWDTDDASEKLLAIARIDHLRYLLMNPELCTSSSLCLTLAQIMTDAEGNLALFVAGLLAATLASCGEYIKEQLEAIINLDAIMAFFFGSSADYAEFQSVLPEYGVEAVPLSFRVDGCDFQMSLDSGENWVTQFTFDLDDCPALQGEAGQAGQTGATGSQGPVGVPGATGPQGPAGPASGPTIESIETSADPFICAGANGINAWAGTLLESGLSAIDSEAAAFAVASSIMAETIIGDIVLNDLLSTIAGFLAIGTTAIRAAHTGTQDNFVTCAFYCAFKALGRAVVAQDILDVAQDLVGESNAWITALAALILTSGGAEFLAAYVAQATNEDNSCASICTECPPEWCHLSDFTLGADGWLVRQDFQYGQLLSQGWTIQQYSGNIYALGFELTFDEAHITEISIEWHFVNADGADQYAVAAGGDSNAIVQPYGTQNRTQTWHPNGDYTHILIATSDNSAAGTPGTYVSSVTIRGTGTNPFGESNC